jgi:phosphatidylglycerol lysyltransferase
MLALAVELATWARDQQYRWLSLGLAPHRGIDPNRRSPAWNRAASVLYRHGEHFEDFHYLREFKESFRPVWEGRYLASPGDLRLANILRDVTRIVSASARGNLGTGTTVVRQPR